LSTTLRFFPVLRSDAASAAASRRSSGPDPDETAKHLTFSLISSAAANDFVIPVSGDVATRRATALLLAAHHAVAAPIQVIPLPQTLLNAAADAAADDAQAPSARSRPSSSYSGDSFLPGGVGGSGAAIVRALLQSNLLRHKKAIIVGDISVIQDTITALCSLDADVQRALWVRSPVDAAATAAAALLGGGGASASPLARGGLDAATVAALDAAAATAAADDAVQRQRARDVVYGNCYPFPLAPERTSAGGAGAVAAATPLTSPVASPAAGAGAGSGALSPRASAGPSPMASGAGRRGWGAGGGRSGFTFDTNTTAVTAAAAAAAAAAAVGRVRVVSTVTPPPVDGLSVLEFAVLETFDVLSGDARAAQLAARRAARTAAGSAGGAHSTTAAAAAAAAGGQLRLAPAPSPPAPTRAGTVTGGSGADTSSPVLGLAVTYGEVTTHGDAAAAAVAAADAGADVADPTAIAAAVGALNGDVWLGALLDLPPDPARRHFSVLQTRSFSADHSAHLHLQCVLVPGELRRVLNPHSAVARAAAAAAEQAAGLQQAAAAAAERGGPGKHAAEAAAAAASTAAATAAAAAAVPVFSKASRARLDALCGQLGMRLNFNRPCGRRVAIFSPTTEGVATASYLRRSGNTELSGGVAGGGGAGDDGLASLLRTQALDLSAPGVVAAALAGMTVGTQVLLFGSESECKAIVKTLCFARPGQTDEVRSRFHAALLYVKCSFACYLTCLPLSLLFFQVGDSVCAVRLRGAALHRHDSGGVNGDPARAPGTRARRRARSHPPPRAARRARGRFDYK
jgi:hypothetical protein